MSAADVAQVLGGKRSGDGYTAPCPAHDDKTPSLMIHERNGRTLVHCHAGCEQSAVLDAIEARGVTVRMKSADDPVLAPFTSHPKLGPPSATYDYHDADAVLVGRVMRFDTPAGKEFRQARRGAGGAWEWKALDAPRPLYRLPELIARPDAPVLVVEGEKAAEAARVALPDYVVTTWAGGSKAATRVDLAPLTHRDVTLWPDADDPGHKAMRDVADALRGRAKVRTVDPSAIFETVPAHADAADVTDWDRARAALNERPAAADADPRSRGPILQWADLEHHHIPPREWIVENWWPRDSVLFAAAGGGGKTSVAQTAGTALALQRPYFGHAAKPLKVLLWGCEDDHNEFWRRQADICTYFGVPLSALAGRFEIEVRKGLDNTLFEVVAGKPMWTPVMATLKEACRDFGADVLILDNVGHLYGGIEHDRHQVTTYVNGCSRLASSVLHLHHVARAQGSEYGGSAAWENACRTRWFMGKTLPGQGDGDDSAADPDVRWLARRKSNYSGEDAVQLRWSNGLFVPVGDMQTTTVDRRMDAQARDVVLTGFRKLRDSGQTCSASTSSGDYLVRKIIDSSLNAGLNRQALARALAKLRTEGVLTTGPVGIYPNRTPRIGLIELHK